MKANLTKKMMIGAALLFTAGISNSQTDLVPGINYSYNPPGSDGIIHSITVDACNNDNGAASSFDVAMYLYDQATTNYWIIGTFNIPGLSGNACTTISNWDIDINNTSGIPAGTYRLGLWVDSGSDVSETDENNNAGLLSGNINYSPNTGISSSEIHVSLLGNFPNPANDQSTVSFNLAKTSKVSLEVFNLTGKKVLDIAKEEFNAGKNSISIDCSKLEDGIYFYHIICDGNVQTKRFSVMH